MPKDFKSLLPPKLIRLLKHKLETGEITPEECKEIIKDMMLREYDRRLAEKKRAHWQALASWLRDRFHTLIEKLWNRHPTEPTIDMEELAGTIRPRHI